MRPNYICCIGKDQIGRARCYVIAFKCPEIRVTILDENESTSEWNSDVLSFYEPELDRIIKKCRNRNLFFTADYSTAIKEADLIFLCVKISVLTFLGGKIKEFDFKELEEAAKLVALHSDSDKIIIEKTNISARAAEKVISVLRSVYKDGIQYKVLSNPEFITEGFSINDLLNPEIVVIGCQNNPVGRSGAESLCELYESWIPRKNIIVLNYWSSEIHKLAVNALLAQKLCSINSLAMICEESGADVSELTKILSKDSRLGSHYMNPSLGFGGFQKDISDLVNMCVKLSLNEVAQYWQAVLDFNDFQIQRFLEKINSILAPLENKIIAVLGFSYRKNTKDTKYSPAIEVCKWLMKEKCHLRIYDPYVETRKILQDLNLDDEERNVQIFSDIYLACNASSAVIICTDRDEVLNLDYSRLGKWVKTPIIIDGRKCLNGNLLKEYGIEYHTIGLSTKAE